MLKMKRNSSKYRKLEKHLSRSRLNKKDKKLKNAVAKGRHVPGF